MRAEVVRRALYGERLLVAFASGVFLTLPLYFKLHGQSETFFAAVYGAGIIGTFTCVGAGAFILRRFGLPRTAPVGSALFCLGSITYVTVIAANLPNWTYGIASVMQGAGWGMIFTIGPICLSTTVDEKTRSYFFAIYAAFSTLGVGVAPIVAKLLLATTTASFQLLYIFATLSSFLGFIVSTYTSLYCREYELVQPIHNLSGWTEFVKIVASPSGYFFALVFLGACVYTTMINLQTTFASAQGIDYTVFYGLYSFSVVFARFFLSRSLNEMPARVTIPCLIALMVLSLVALTFAKLSAFCYGVGALGLGTAYGLVYPLIQAEAARHATSELRAPTLVYFSLAYFFAVYLFPYVAANIAHQVGYIALMSVLITVAALQFALAIYVYVGAIKPRMVAW